MRRRLRRSATSRSLPTERLPETTSIDLAAGRHNGDTVLPCDDRQIRLRIPATTFARVLQGSLAPKYKGGRRESRVRAAPAVSRANCASTRNAHEHTGSAEAVRPSLRNGFTAYFVLSPVTGLIATVIPLRNLTPASGCQDHTTSPSASVPLVHARKARDDAAASTASHLAQNDDHDTPLIRGGTQNRSC